MITLHTRAGGDVGAWCKSQAGGFWAVMVRADVDELPAVHVMIWGVSRQELFVTVTVLVPAGHSPLLGFCYSYSSSASLFISHNLNSTGCSIASCH